MNILNNYPIGRLGSATTAITTSSATSSTHQPKDDSIKTVDTNELAKAGAETAQAVLTAISRPAYPLSTIIMTAVIFFLLGSLVRSLQTPADFILLPPSASGLNSEDAIVVELNRFFDDINSGSSSITTREMRRVLEIKRVLRGWDFVVAFARRR